VGENRVPGKGTHCPLTPAAVHPVKTSLLYSEKTEAPRDQVIRKYHNETSYTVHSIYTNKKMWGEEVR
jgi:hypothetical protein